MLTIKINTNDHVQQTLLVKGLAAQITGMDKPTFNDLSFLLKALGYSLISTEALETFKEKEIEKNPDLKEGIPFNEISTVRAVREKQLEQGKKIIQEKEKSEFVSVDPPEGWKYGFPKLCPRKIVEAKDGSLIKWILENGYPKARYEYFGDQFPVGISG